MTRPAYRPSAARPRSPAAPCHTRSTRVSRASLAVASRPRRRINPLPARDEFDNWAEQRNRREDASPAARYVSREVTGYEDLDDYGDWRSDPSYGEVWLPRVAVGWSPYHYGHWVWVSPWGWTWVDDAPWGFAPSHYRSLGFHARRLGLVSGARHCRATCVCAGTRRVRRRAALQPEYIGGWPAASRLVPRSAITRFMCLRIARAIPIFAT